MASAVKVQMTMVSAKKMCIRDRFYPKVAEILPALEHPVKVLIARIRDELKAPLRLSLIHIS